jgi:hypothetical protein
MEKSLRGFFSRQTKKKLFVRGRKKIREMGMSAKEVFSKIKKKENVDS